MFRRKDSAFVHPNKPVSEEERHDRRAQQAEDAQLIDELLRPILSHESGEEALRAGTHTITSFPAAEGPINLFLGAFMTPILAVTSILIGLVGFLGNGAHPTSRAICDGQGFELLLTLPASMQFSRLYEESQTHLFYDMLMLTVSGTALFTVPTILPLEGEADSAQWYISTGYYSLCAVTTALQFVSLMGWISGLTAASMIRHEVFPHWYAKTGLLWRKKAYAAHARGAMALMFMVATTPLGLNYSRGWHLSALPTGLGLYVLSTGLATWVATPHVAMARHCKRMAFPKNVEVQRQHLDFAARLATHVRADRGRADKALEVSATQVTRLGTTKGGSDA
jgi:hypothetical protein